MYFFREYLYLFRLGVREYFWFKDSFGGLNLNVGYYVYFLELIMV